jgi:TROVE domain
MNAIQIDSVQRVKRSTNVTEVVKLMHEFDLPREAIPTQCLNEAAVWEALLANMSMTGMIRNGRFKDSRMPKRQINNAGGGESFRPRFKGSKARKKTAQGERSETSALMSRSNREGSWRTATKCKSCHADFLECQPDKRVPIDRDAANGV